MLKIQNLNQEQIHQIYLKIDKQEQKLADRLIKLQSLCIHPNVSKIPGGNTGNYDPSADSYWIEYKCSDCGKNWIEDQK